MGSTVTPFIPATLSAPDDGVTLAVPTVFRWNSLRSPGSTIIIRYALQFSSSPLFPNNATQTIIEFDDTQATGIIGTPRAINEVQTAFPGTTDIYWRVGTRNASESGAYTFSGVRRFKKPVNPPNP